MKFLKSGEKGRQIQRPQRFFQGLLFFDAVRTCSAALSMEARDRSTSLVVVAQELIEIRMAV